MEFFVEKGEKTLKFIHLAFFNISMPNRHNIFITSRVKLSK